MFPIIKNINYKITDPFYSEIIQLDVNEYPTLIDLKKIIASIWNYSDIQIQINNPPEENRLKKIEENYIFDISIHNRCKNILFRFPDDQIIQIKNGYRKGYAEIIRTFRKYNLYFSKKCIKHILFFVSNIEIPNKEFPFLAIPRDSFVDVKMSCDVIVLNYGENKFLFRENESAYEAYKLIQKVFDGYHSISIFNDQNEKLNYTDELVRYEEYQIQVIYRFTFENVECNSEFIQNLDFFSTVFDAQNSLSKIYKKFPEDIILYDDNMEKINNTNELLINIHSIDQLFQFEVDNYFGSFYYEKQEIKKKKHSQTPDKKFANYSSSIDLDILLKHPIYSKTQEIKIEHKIGDPLNNKNQENKSISSDQNESLLETESDSDDQVDLMPINQFDGLFSCNKITNIKSIYDDEDLFNSKIKNKSNQFISLNKKESDQKNNILNDDNIHPLINKHKNDDIIQRLENKQKNKENAQSLKNKNKNDDNIKRLENKQKNDDNNQKLKNKKFQTRNKKENEILKHIDNITKSKNDPEKHNKQKFNKKSLQTTSKKKQDEFDNKNINKKNFAKKESIIIEEEEEEKSDESDDEQSNLKKLKSKKIINIYDDFYKKEEARPNSSFKNSLSKINFSNQNNYSKRDKNNDHSPNPILEKEEFHAKNKIDICKSMSEDSASEIEMNSSDKDNISDIHSNHLTLSPNCNSMHLSDLEEDQIIEEEEEEID